MFKRRVDYRDAQRLKDEAAKEAKEKAIEDAQKAQEAQIANIKKYQKMALDANNQGVTFGKAGRWAEACAQHELAVQYDPTNKQYRINLSAARVAFGQERMAHKDYASAASLFRKAVSAAPDNGLAAKSLADALTHMGLDPSLCDVRLKLGDDLAAASDLEGALIEYQQAMALESSARTCTKMGDMAYRCGQVPTAANWYRQAIIKNADYAPAHRQLGLLAMAQKDLTGAATSLRKAVILDPKDEASGQALVEIWRRQVAANPLLAENHLGLAGAYQLTGQFAEAENEYNKLETLDSKNPGLAAGRESLTKAIDHTKAEKHKLAAETLFNQGIKRDALAEISQAAMLEPRNASYQFLLGECLESAGDYQSAHQAYLTCVLIDPENNHEAAARMKAMETSLKQQGVNVAQSDAQMANELANKLSQHFDGKGEEQVQNALPSLPSKDLVEGAQSAGQSTGPMAFAMHDDSVPKAVASNQAPVTTQTTEAVTTQAAATPADLASQIDKAEAAKDYAGAVALLRYTLDANLQNADVHHRLAADLLYAGQTADALSEFRIASALAPTRKDFADDLAKAMQVHKASQLASDTQAGGGK